MPFSPGWHITAPHAHVVVCDVRPHTMHPDQLLCSSIACLNPLAPERVAKQRRRDHGAHTGVGMPPSSRKLNHLVSVRHPLAAHLPLRTRPSTIHFPITGAEGWRVHGSPCLDAPPWDIDRQLLTVEGGECCHQTDSFSMLQGREWCIRQWYRARARTDEGIKFPLIWSPSGEAGARRDRA